MNYLAANAATAGLAVRENNYHHNQYANDKTNKKSNATGHADIF